MEQKIRITVKDLLKLRGQTLYWLSKTTGISYTTLWRLTKGRALGINFVTLEKICGALECQPGELMKVDKISKEEIRKGNRPSRMPLRRTTSLL